MLLATAAMGTRFELTLAAGRSHDLRAAGEAALEEIGIWHRRLSRFAPDSLVSHLNREAHHRAVPLDAETFALFDDALSVWRASNGAFDIACAPLVTASGFAPSATSVKPGPALQRIPSPDTRMRAGSSARSARSASDAIELDRARWTIRFTRPGVSLDLGAIGKGHALDCSAAVLVAHGVTSALLHGGASSVVTIGAPPGADGWRVALAGNWDVGVLTLVNSAMAMSHTDSQRSASGASHIVDPRVGGARGAAASPVGAPRVVVTGPSARLADAWATALAVMGQIPDTLPAGYQARFENGHAT